MTEREFTGILEMDKKGGGTVRTISREYEPRADDIHVPRALVDRYALREGCLVEGIADERNRRWEISLLRSVCGLQPDRFAVVPELTRQTPVAPVQRIILETSDPTMRMVDLLVPIGRGQRMLIVAPPRSGKTILLQKFAEAIAENHPDLELLMLLIDERPEEVTEMQRSTAATVFASSNDRDFQSHARIGRLTLEYAKRQVEVGRDVVILLDSLTRVGRAYNTGTRGSGRIMSGGIDARALEIPKRIFGASRKIENGGSLTIIATILTDTGSRMDELIFQEFKGTGNSELVLDRELADLRIYPAIDIERSGTRREELLLGDEVGYHHALRRALVETTKREGMRVLSGLVDRFPRNVELLRAVADGALGSKGAVSGAEKGRS